MQTGRKLTGWVLLPVLTLAGICQGWPNLIVNGDFQNGNQDFYTEFKFSPGNIVPEHTYEVLSDPHLSHPNATSYFDHTLGTADGLMMAVNGRDQYWQPDVVWAQTVYVTSGTTYTLAFWHSLWCPGPAGLQVYINGVPLGQEFMAGSDELGEWVAYRENWEAFSASIAHIEIVNTTVSVGANDFALDDIVFTDFVSLDRDTWAGIKAIGE
jgi:hypothetical protein